MLTKQDLMILSGLLEMAADTYSNRGCNDLSEDLVSTVTNQDALCAEIKEWNGDAESEWPESIDYIGDSTLMSFYAAKLSKIAAELK